MKKLLLFILFIIAGHHALLAQDKLSLDQKKAMLQKSQFINLDKSALQKAKEYATSNNYAFKNIQKNFPHLQVIYNNELKASDRYAYCTYLLALCENDKSSLPKPLIEKQQKLLQEKLLRNE